MHRVVKEEGKRLAKAVHEMSSKVQVFKEMKAHSEKDRQCVPNVITYSALMTACCSGGRPDKAHEVFQDMVASGIKPDQISYSTLIAGRVLI